MLILFKFGPDFLPAVIKYIFWQSKKYKASVDWWNYFNWILSQLHIWIQEMTWFEMSWNPDHFLFSSYIFNLLPSDKKAPQVNCTNKFTTFLFLLQKESCNFKLFSMTIFSYHTCCANDLLAFVVVRNVFSWSLFVINDTSLILVINDSWVCSTNFQAAFHSEDLQASLERWYPWLERSQACPKDADMSSNHNNRIKWPDIWGHFLLIHVSAILP